MTRDEFQAQYPARRFGKVRVSREFEYTPDWKIKLVLLPGLSGEGEVIAGTWRFNLPHQCDAWEIGTVRDAKEMLFNLGEAIAYAEANP